MKFLFEAILSSCRTNVKFKKVFCNNGMKEQKRVQNVNVVRKMLKQVRSDNDTSEVDIFGHYGTIWKTLRRVWSI